MKAYIQNFQCRLMVKIFIVALSVILVKAVKLRKTRDVIFRLRSIHPCQENPDIIFEYTSDLTAEEKNYYKVYIPGNFTKNSKAVIKFDSEALVTLDKTPNARLATASDIAVVYVFNSVSSIGLKIKGPNTDTLPFIENLVINGVENCKNPDIGDLNEHLLTEENTVEALPDDSCGRRKVSHTELIVNGQPTKAGDWPWHAAIYTLNGYYINYICGGTLLSKTVVLTAAHCVTIRGVPRITNSLSVILGKYNLIGGDIDSQERQVQEIIVHEQYELQNLTNDIALLKLHEKAYEKLPRPGLFGMVVGWGIDQTTQLSPQLQQARMPIVSELTCIKSNPVVFARLLNSQKFCAGERNGTSACNGDSGGGFTIFVPDITGDASANAKGAWHVRGIVSTSVSKTNEAVCDPKHYVLFTDVEKFRAWILWNMN